MAYVALYREWRPKTFVDIIGQKHISTTLINALESGRIAHAYLFCGPRGTGKTSTAKVLAKALNCQTGATAQPCNECTNCQRINLGNSLDVLEIDAASNRGIDEIRDLREKVKFAATEGAYKVYIIDEVHMLTTEAFNALLKTLEEPPSHVVFILATTEPHKIPLTILSRCQRFDFKRISMNDIIDRLRFVIKNSNYAITDQALALIARASEGGMRDALNLLDQCIAFSGDKVTEEHVAMVLGSVNTDLLLKFSEEVARNNTAACLRLLDQVIREGKDPKQFIKDLTEHFRNVLLLKVTDFSEGLVVVPSDVEQQLIQQVSGYNVDKLIETINILNETEREMKWAIQPRIHLEIALIKINNTQKTIPELTGYLAKIEELEERINSLSTANVNISKGAAAKKASARRSGAVELGTNDEAGLKEIINVWPDILEGVKKSKVAAYALLQEGKPAHFNNGGLTLIFKDSHTFHKDKLDQLDMRSAVEGMIKKVIGKDIKLRCVVEAEIKGSGTKSTDSVKNHEDIKQEASLFFGTDSIEIQD